MEIVRDWVLVGSRNGKTLCSALLFILHPFLLGFHYGHYCFLCQWADCSWLSQESINRSVCLNSPTKPFHVQCCVCCYLPQHRDSKQPPTLLCAFAKWNSPLPVRARRINGQGVWAVWCRRKPKWEPKLISACRMSPPPPAEARWWRELD